MTTKYKERKKAVKKIVMDNVSPIKEGITRL